MGVRGLQSFMDRCCPEACVTVNLREMTRRHAAETQRGGASAANGTSPTLVVDGMACLRHWYSCKDWVCGGQWKEYIDNLKSWVEAFTSAGIKLVFFFDGVVEEKKRQEWVKRRLRVNKDVSKVFSHIKEYGEQPGKQLFCLPSGLATFTPFALKSLGQQVFCSVREADYEISSYACQHGSMGILGQDSDFLIYDSVPYFSVAKLRINSLTTVMYDRQRLCTTIGLSVSQLPLLACLLGNDVVAEEQMQLIRDNAMVTYRKNNPAPYSGTPQGQVVLAVAQFVRSLYSRDKGESELVPQSLNVSAADRQLLKNGICSYLLPGNKGFEPVPFLPSTSDFKKHVHPEILKACREKHVAAEGFMVYSVVCAGVTECSNSLEDEEDTELLPQAIVYKMCRQRVYGLLLLLGQDDRSEDFPAVKEWFVFPGNPLKEPDMVHPVPVIFPCEQPSLDLLWFHSGPEVSDFRLTAFLSIFDCLDYSEVYGAIDDSLLAALCLVTYIVLQVQTLSQEDIDAYLSQAVCLRLNSSLELQQFELPLLSSRAVQLGSLYVRGLSHLLGANTASGCPLPSFALMPWHCFDGRLFHSKYLLAHSGKEKAELLDNDESCLSLFHHLKEKLLETCRKRGRVLQSRPKGPQDRLSGGELGGGRQYFNSFRPDCGDGQPQSMSRPPKQFRGRSHHYRGRYQLAPRWSQPPAP
ncbi:constitutive coactivator of peroxisome proliferator-activated receptor gamma [Xenentodon cancila]